jgi:hypothetical protein
VTTSANRPELCLAPVAGASSFLFGLARRGRLLGGGGLLPRLGFLRRNGRDTSGRAGVFVAFGCSAAAWVVAFSDSWIDVVIFLSFSAVITAVTTWITLVRGESKWIICKGAKAMVWRWRFGRRNPARCLQMSSDDRPRLKIRAQEGGCDRRVADASDGRRSCARDQRGNQDAPALDEGARVRCRLPCGETSGFRPVHRPVASSTKVRASDSILNHTIKAIETEDIEARLAELERSADQNKSGWRK